MKNYLNKSALFIVLLLINFTSYSQDYVEMMENSSSNFYDVQHKFNTYWENKEIERGKGYNVFRRWEAYMAPRVYPTGNMTLPSQNYENYLAWEKANGKKGIVKSVSGNWTLMGPVGKPIGGGAGRVNFIRFHPTISTTIFIGTPDGGLWKTTNGGTSWTTNTDQLSVIGCTDIAIDPTNTQIMYLATGDGEAGDSYSLGVLKSTDGGNTWNTTGMVWDASQGIKISRLLIHPTNPLIVMAFGNNGIWRTTNGGTTWTQPTGTFNGIKDAEYKPNDPNTVYAAGTSFKKSTDGGLNWTTVATGLTGVGRLSIAVTAANPAYVYVLAAKNSDYGFLALIRSTNSGSSFTTRSTTPNILGWGNGADSGGQGWYDLAIASSPTNAEEVMIGGVNMWKSTNGGTTWTLNSHWYGGFSQPYVHADIHDIQYLPGSGTNIYSGNDGGVFATTNSGTSWTDISANLAIAQQYRIGLSTSNASLLLAGHQDNGTNLYNGSSWSQIYGGDGMDCFIDRTNNNNMFGSYVYGDYYRSTNGGASFSDINTGLPTGNKWLSIFHQDPVTAATIYAGGRTALYKTTNSGTAWSVLGTPTGAGSITEFVIAPSNNQIIYAVKSGTNAVSKSINGGISFTTVSSGLPTTVSPTCITVSNTDPNMVFVCYSGYGASAKVYKSLNGGSSWINLSTGFPNIPVNCIVYLNGSANNAIYVGTDVGVYYMDNSTAWIAFNTGLPNISVSDLEIYYPTGRLRAATFGRGTWDSDLYNSVPSVPIASFTSTTSTICQGQTVTYTNTSSGIPTSYSWVFSGGTPATSTATNPIVTYNTAGTYTTELTATNTSGSNTLTQTNYVTVLSGNGSALPLNEGFTAATFPPTNWVLLNVDLGATTWARSATIGLAPTAGNSLFFDNYNYDDAGNTDEVRTPRLNFQSLSSAQMTFDVAYARYDAIYTDGLEVLVSSDCGTTFTSVYSKSGTVLATAPDLTTIFTPTTAQWRTETINLNSYIGQGNVTIAVRNIAGFGNRLFVDNINITGVVTASPPIAGFTSTPAGTACTGQTVQYTSTSTGTPTSYAWVFQNGTPATSTTQNPIVTYNIAGTYDVSLTATNESGSNTSTQTSYIAVNSAPSAPGSISGIASVCNGSTGNVYTISPVAGATSYTWTVPAGSTITAGQGTTSATVTFGSSSGNVTVTAINICGNSSVTTLAITLNLIPATPGTISSPASICASSTGNIFSISTVSGATSYTWSVPGGAIVTSGQGTTSATITFGATSGNVTVTANNSCGTSAVSSFNVSLNAVPTAPISITGSATACSGSTGNSYSISTVAGATNYTWTVPSGASITSGQGTSSATVTFGSTAGNVAVTASNSCGTSAATILPITLTSAAPATPGAIVGNNSVCSTSSGNIYSISPVSGATNYTWTVPTGASVTSGQGTISATITFGATSGNVTVTASSSCGTSAASSYTISFTPAPMVPGTITGTSTICAGAIGNTFSIAAVSGATNYTWSVPSGATIISGQGTISSVVNFGIASGNVSVSASNICGTSVTSDLSITVNPVPTVTQATYSSVCVNSATFALSGGSPAGGTYTGTGVTTNNFNPTTAGVGSHQILYTYTLNGCYNTANSSIIVDACVGIEEIGQDLILLYPNPTDGLLTVEGESLVNFDNMIMVDASGRIVEKWEISGNKLSFDMRKYAQGSYSLRFTGSKGEIVRKIQLN